MIIDVLVCKPDGVQVIEQREVPDNWFDAPPPAPVDEITVLKLAIAELAEAQAADILDVQLAIAELAEALLGGE